MLKTKLTEMPYLYQVTFRIQDLVACYGRERVIAELFEATVEDSPVGLHVENLYGTYDLSVMNEAKQIMFSVEFKKVG